MANALRRRLATRGWLATSSFLIDRALKTLIRVLLSQHVRWHRFGWIEALAYSWRLDVWFRHSHVVRALHKLAPAHGRLTVLDVGGAGSQLTELLDPRRFQVTSLDLTPRLVLSEGNIGVVGDGCALPFRDASFHFVTSVDVLEHVPRARKTAFLASLRRVARLGVIIHTPAVSTDGSYQGDVLDREFQSRHLSAFGRTEPFTLEHEMSGWPTIELIQGAFPTATFRGTESGPAWLSYMILERRPVLGLLAGALYKIRLEAKDQGPPYHGVLATLDLTNGADLTHGAQLAA